MRILGFSKKWDKLQQGEFTTFRFPRKDRDWSAGEEVQVVFKPRRKGGGEKLGNALIIHKKSIRITEITEEEAVRDGFLNAFAMWLWLGKPSMLKEINKLALVWILEGELNADS